MGMYGLRAQIAYHRKGFRREIWELKPMEYYHWLQYKNLHIAGSIYVYKSIEGGAFVAPIEKIK